MWLILQVTVLTPQAVCAPSAGALEQTMFDEDANGLLSRSVASQLGLGYFAIPVEELENSWQGAGRVPGKEGAEEINEELLQPLPRRHTSRLSFVQELLVGLADDLLEMGVIVFGDSGQRIEDVSPSIPGPRGFTNTIPGYAYLSAEKLRGLGIEDEALTLPKSPGHLSELRRLRCPAGVMERLNSESDLVDETACVLHQGVIRNLDSHEPRAEGAASARTDRSAKDPFTFNLLLSGSAFHQGALPTLEILVAVLLNHLLRQEVVRSVRGGSRWIQGDAEGLSEEAMGVEIHVASEGAVKVLDRLDLSVGGGGPDPGLAIREVYARGSVGLGCTGVSVGQFEKDGQSIGGAPAEVEVGAGIGADEELDTIEEPSVGMDRRYVHERTQVRRGRGEGPVRQKGRRKNHVWWTPAGSRVCRMKELSTVPA